MNATYEDARAKLMDKEGNPTPEYKKYLRYEAEYKRKADAWHKAYAAALTDPVKLSTWPIEGVDYRDAADDALERWMAFGFKADIESALTTVAAHDAAEQAASRKSRSQPCNKHSDDSHNTSATQA